MDNLPTPYVNINAKFKKDGHVIEKLGFYSSTFKNPVHLNRGIQKQDFGVGISFNVINVVVEQGG